MRFCECIVFMYILIGRVRVQGAYEAILTSDVPSGCETKHLVLTLEHPNATIRPTIILASNELSESVVMHFTISKVTGKWTKRDLENTLFSQNVNFQALTKRKFQMNFTGLTSSHRGNYKFEMRSKDAVGFASNSFHIGKFLDKELQPAVSVGVERVHPDAQPQKLNIEVKEHSNIVIHTNRQLPANIKISIQNDSIVCYNTSTCIVPMLNFTSCRQNGTVMFSYVVEYLNRCAGVKEHVLNMTLWMKADDSAAASSPGNTMVWALVVATLGIALVVIAIVYAVHKHKQRDPVALTTATATPLLATPSGAAEGDRADSTSPQSGPTAGTSQNDSYVLDVTSTIDMFNRSDSAPLSPTGTVTALMHFLPKGKCDVQTAKNPLQQTQKTLPTVKMAPSASSHDKSEPCGISDVDHDEYEGQEIKEQPNYEVLSECGTADKPKLSPLSTNRGSTISTAVEGRSESPLSHTTYTVGSPSKDESLQQQSKPLPAKTPTTRESLRSAKEPEISPSDTISTVDESPTTDESSQQQSKPLLAKNPSTSKGLTTSTSDGSPSKDESSQQQSKPLLAKKPSTSEGLATSTVDESPSKDESSQQQSKPLLAKKPSTSESLHSAKEHSKSEAHANDDVDQDAPLLTK